MVDTPFLFVSFDVRTGAVARADQRFVEMLERTGGDLPDFWDLLASGQRNRVTNEITQQRHGFDVDFVGGSGQVVTLRVAGALSEGGVVSLWLLPVGESDARDAGATEKALRKQNGVLLDLARVEAIDDGHLDVAFARITEAAAAGLGCARSSVWLYEETGASIVCHDLFQIQDGSHGAKGFTLTAAAYPSYFAALAEDRTIAADDCREHPATREFKDGYLVPLGITSMLEAPIRRKGKLIGVLCNEHVGPIRSFSQEEQNFAANVADYVGRALEASDRRSAMAALGEAHQALAQHAADLERKVAERTRAIQLILDSTGDGLLTCDLAGVVASESSKTLRTWFGEPAPGALAKDYLFPAPSQQASFALQLEQLGDDVLPFDCVVDPMPRQFVREGRTFRVHYRPVEDGGAQIRLLCVVRDATAEVAAERAAREARELQAVASHVVRDRSAFMEVLAECDALVTTLERADDVSGVKRAMHTLKGNTAVYGLESVAEAVHDAETRLEEDPSALAEARSAAASAWRDAHGRIAKVFGVGTERTIQVEEREYEAFVKDLVAAKVRHELVDAVRSWRAVPTRAILDRLARQVERVAERLEKPVDVEVSDPGLRLPLEGMGPFWSGVVHVVRNAVDHGIEEEAERVAAGKPARGRVRLEVVRRDGQFEVAISDDGRGVDWDALARKAEARGLPASTRSDVEEALFADGVSTRDEVTDVSGRGVGLGAVRATVRELGGAVVIESSRGEGTLFRFVFPLRDALPSARAA